MSPDKMKPFYLETDASKHATGAVLMQHDSNGDLKPCGFISKALTPPEKNYQIYDREMLAVFRGFKMWRHYLLGAEHPTTVRCDHKNLLYFRAPQLLTPRQARWQIFMSQFDFTMTHIPGPQLVQADSLSRRPDHEIDDENEEQIMLPDSLFIHATEVTVQDNQLLERIRVATAIDDTALELTRANDLDRPNPFKSTLTDWNLDNGLAWYKGRLYVPNDLDLKREIVKQHHDFASAGHPGHYGTQALVQRIYWWPRMSTFVKKYVDGCAQCQQNKINTHPTTPPLMPIKADQDALPFSTISMDFITDLPESNGYTALLVIVDHNLSKGVILIPCTKEETAMSTAILYH
jgi:hypothetical protein